MFELRFFDGWNANISSYYMIYKNGKLWSPFGHSNALDAIAEIALVDREAANNLELSVG